MSQDAMKTSAQNGSKSWFLQYWKDSGPGWLQSAITLGAGTLASSLFLGVVGGCDLIWVQPCAMASGAVMLAAIAYATLSMQRSPFDAIRRDLNPVLAWGWLLGALINNTIYALPQFAASYAAITVEELMKRYPLDGLQYGAERVGPLSEVLFRGMKPACFCQYCRARNRLAGIDSERAREGYRRLYEFIKG